LINDDAALLPLATAVTCRVAVPTKLRAYTFAVLARRKRGIATILGKVLCAAARLGEVLCAHALPILAIRLTGAAYAVTAIVYRAALAATADLKPSSTALSADVGAADHSFGATRVR
jgi:hypothetical protein